MNAKDLNEAFLEACEQCPNFQGFDSDLTEIVNGSYVNVAKLHTKGVVAVIRYWRDEDTVGGSIIHRSGYLEELPAEVTELLDSIDSIIDEAISEAIRAAKEV
jgi:hypothetical protein